MREVRSLFDRGNFFRISTTLNKNFFFSISLINKNEMICFSSFIFAKTARAVDEKNRILYMNLQRQLERNYIMNRDILQGQESIIDDIRRKITEKEERKMAHQEEKRRP